MSVFPPTDPPEEQAPDLENEPEGGEAPPAEAIPDAMESPLPGAAPEPETPVSPNEAVTVEIEQPLIPLDVFVVASGKRADQARGFAIWAKSNDIVTRTMLNWEMEWRRYLERPIK